MWNELNVRNIKCFRWNRMKEDPLVLGAYEQTNRLIESRLGSVEFIQFSLQD